MPTRYSAGIIREPALRSVRRCRSAIWSLASSRGARNGADRTTKPPKHERGPLAVNRRRDAAISRRRDPMLERGEGEDPIISGATRAGDFAIENGRRRFEGRAAMVTRRTSVSGAASEQRSEENTSELQSLMRI